MSKAHDVKRRRVDADGSRTESPDAGKPTDRQASHSAAASVAETEPWGPGCMLLGVIAVGTLTLLVTFALYRQQELGYSRSEEKATDVDDSVGADGHAKPLFPVYATDQLFTRDELSSHGSSSKRIHLAILGRVYDVTKGRKYYGPKGGYAFFAGRDATRSFVSGDFSDAGLTDDLEGLSIREYLGIADWVGTYEKEYKYVGRLIGRFYDGDGRPTDSLLDAENKIRLAGEMKSKEDDMKKLFPPCNSRWAAGKGEVWCSNKSGGIHRDWVGVPRKMFVPGGSAYRCACVKDSGAASDGSDTGGRGDLDNPQLNEYQNCSSKSATCAVDD